MSKERVSVVIVNYNGANFVKKCIDSVLRQDYPSVEIIVVDNASTDKSLSLLEEYGSKIILVKSSRNTGFAGGNNLGIERARGSLILLLNCDAWIDPSTISKLFQAKISNGYDVVAPLETSYDKKDIKPYRTTIDPLGHPVYLSLDKRQSFFLSGVCVMFNKEFYLDTGGLDNNFFMYFEEIDWFWRLQLANATIAYLPNTFVHHLGAGSSGSGLKINSFMWRNQNTLQMLLKNYSFITLCFVLPIYICVNILEALAFLFTLKPALAATYPKGWWFNIKHLRNTLATRAKSQAMRKKSDIQVLKLIYPGFGKARHLYHFVSKKSAFKD